MNRVFNTFPFVRDARSILPGYRASMAVTLFWLAAIVLVPLLVLVLSVVQLPAEKIWETMQEPRVIAAFRISVLAAFIAAVIATFCGTLMAWVLVRYRFPGRPLLDALVDIPFALPTAIAGIALSAIYAPDGWVGAPLQALGIELAFNRAGIVLALVFLGLPFVVRTIQPVLDELDPEIEEAAGSLGANRWQVIKRILLPQLIPSILSGFALAFARGLGEYGSVIFLAGNVPLVSEIVPLVIITKLEGYDMAGASVVAVAMLLLSFAMLYLLNYLQRWRQQRLQGLL